MQQSGVGYCEFLVGRGNGRALENVSPGALQDRALCYVGDQAGLYRLDKFSLADVAPPYTIATSLGVDARGRWSRVTELTNAQPGSRLLANGTRFSSIIEQAQMAAAGEQVPAYTMTGAMPTLSTIRHAVGEGMYLR